MLIFKRIAVVFWWSGTFLFSLALYSFGNSFWQQSVCSDVFAEEESLKSEAMIQTDQNLQRLPSKPADPNAKSEDLLGEFFLGRDRSVLPANEKRSLSEIWEHVVTIKDLPRRAGFDDDLKRCKELSEKPNHSGLDGLIIGFILWIISYILGGRFWGPPKSS